jgi:hypothetical protein
MLALEVEVGIAEIAGQHCRIVLDGRTEQQRALSLDQQFQPGEIPGVLVEQAIRPAAGV